LSDGDWGWWSKGYLDIGGVSNSYIAGIGHINPGGYGTTASVSIYGQSNIVAGGAFGIQSDLRTKTNITDINDNKALNDLRLLQPKTFNFIDRINQQLRYGFIAQEVEKILPYSIIKSTGFVPNFLVGVEISIVEEINNSNKKEYICLVSHKPNTETNKVNYKFNFIGNHDKISGNELKNDNNQPVSDLSGNQVFKVTLLDIDTTQKFTAYTRKIINDTEFLITSDKEIHGTYFLIGQDVDDFNNLDYDAITTINTSAIQEIDRQQQADKARIVELETKVAEQQSLINNIIERLNKIGA
jgi:hypothetical protein